MTSQGLSCSIMELPDIKTKLNIMHAIDKPIEKMTIDRICQGADISRQTFYKHFESKMDIASWYILFCRQFYLNEIGRSMSFQMGYYHHLRLVSQERDFFRFTLRNLATSPFAMNNVIENRQTVLTETLTEYKKITVDANLAFLVSSFSKTECEVLDDWFISSKATDLDIWTNDLVSLVPSRLYKLLEIESN